MHDAAQGGGEPANGSGVSNDGGGAGGDAGAAGVPAWLDWLPSPAGPHTAAAYAHYTDAKDVLDVAQPFCMSLPGRWDGPVLSLDEAAIAAAGAGIAAAWAPVRETAAAVERNNPAQAAQAETWLSKARGQVGNCVSLQSVKGSGHNVCVDHGPDVEGFIAGSVATAQAMARDCKQIVALCHSGCDDDTGTPGEIGAIMERHPTESELNFMDLVFGQQGVLAQVHGLGHQATTVAGALAASQEHDKLKSLKQRGVEASVATRDGADAVPPEKIAQMEKDADTLADEADATVYASDSKINAILAKYPPAERAVFFRIVDRRNLLDTLIKRGDTDHVLGAIRETPGFGGYHYQAAMATGRGIGEQAAYIGDEAAREAPGAALHFMAGVYDGMSHIPIIGGAMKNAAQGCRDLGDEVDADTNAWKDGLKVRNFVAEKAGMLTEKIAEYGAGGEFQEGQAIETLQGSVEAVEVVNGVKTAKELVDTGLDVKRAYDFVQEMRETYDSFFSGWELFSTLLQSNLGNMSTEITDIVTGDDVGAATAGLAMISSGFDVAIGQVEGLLSAGFTEKGAAAAKKKAQAKAEAKDPALKEQRQEKEKKERLRSVPLDMAPALAELQAAHDAPFDANDPAALAAHQARLTAAADKVKAAYAANPDPGIMGIKRGQSNLAQETKKAQTLNQRYDDSVAADEALHGEAVAAQRREDQAARQNDVDRSTDDTDDGPDYKAAAKHELGQLLRTMLVEIGVGILKSVKNELINALTAEIGGRAHEFDPHLRYAIAQGVASGAETAISSIALPLFKTQAVEKIAGIVGRALEHEYPGLGLLVEPLKAGASALVDWAWGHWNVDSWASGKLAQWVADVIPGDTSQRKDDYTFTSKRPAASRPATVPESASPSPAAPAWSPFAMRAQAMAHYAD